MSTSLSYNKQEKLKSKKQIDHLFSKGKSFTVFPIKVWYAFADDEENKIKTGVGVSSRFFKSAVQRNRVKRLLREAYRMEKEPLYNYINNNKKQLVLFLLFVDKTLPQYEPLKQKMQLCLQRLIKELNEATVENT